MEKEENKTNCSNEKAKCCNENHEDHACHCKSKEGHCSAQHSNENVEFLKTIRAEIEKLKEENAELKDTALRYRAEIENLRKRFEKEKEDSLKFAHSKFAKDLLSVADSFEMALKNSAENGDAKSILEGVEITNRELNTVFQRNGVVKIELQKGDDFNHDLHQIMCELDDASIDPGKVAVIYQNGYTINGRLLRPALVGITKKNS